MGPKFGRNTFTYLYLLMRLINLCFSSSKWEQQWMMTLHLRKSGEDGWPTLS